MNRVHRWALATLAAAALAPGATPLAAQQYFGQNQVQYDKFDWKVLETEHFKVHFYPETEETARIAGQMAERTYARLSRVLNHQFREKKPIIVFASRTDFAQNNIFGDPGEGTGGVTDWLRQRNTLYFIGDYGEFEHVLAHEMVHVFQYDIFSRGRAGANFQSIARVAPPLWFMEGMAEYLSIGPEHAHTNAVLRDAALNGRVPSIEAMTLRPDLYFPYRFGSALWEYIGKRWGDQSIGDLMNAVPSLGIERAFRRELGMPLEQLGDEWREAMQTKHLPQVAERQRARRFAEPLLTQRRTGGAVPIYVAPTLSPDGEQVAYLSTGNFFRAEIFLDLYLADTKDGRRRARLTKSVLNSEFEELRTAYSQSAFSPDGQFLAFTTQRRGKDILVLLDVRRRRVVRSYEGLPLEQMLGPTFSPDGQRIAFVGATGERSDLYVMNVDGSGLRQITDDVYGDAQPSWSPDGRYIAFASERGPQSDVEVLRFGKWRISVYDMENNTLEVLPGQDGRNINPQWSPDSRSIAYVSDRTGIANIFLYELAEREHYQLTDVFSAVSSFTEISPAISWARRADKLAFVYYENGDYSVWWINNPRRLKGDPLRDAPAAPVVASGRNGANSHPHAANVPDPETGLPLAVAASDSLRTAPADTAQRSVLLDSTPERISVYRAAGGLRASDVLRPGESRSDGVTVAALLDSASLALPDTSAFRVYDYKGGFQPEYVSRPTIGYTQDTYGRGVVGGTTIVLSDLLGNQRLLFSGAVNGRFSESQLFAAYANYSNRLQYILGASQAPYFLLAGGGFTQQPNNTVLEEQLIYRLIFRDVFASGYLPRNRFTRFEFGGRLGQVDRSVFAIRRLLDQATGAPLTYYSFEGVEDLGAATMISPYVAYVSDNALFGYTSPILGRRYRLQAAPTFGSWQFVEYLADYRRYDPLLFNLFTIATRVQGVARVGPDEAELPPDGLRPEYIRGYDREFIYGRRCVNPLDLACVGYDELIGTRMVFTNAEFRFPLLRRFELGFLPLGLPPMDGHVFYDAGVAWNPGQRVVLSRADRESVNDRSVLQSWGVGARVNLFNIAILRLDYAIPLSQPDRKGYWSFLLGGPGF